MAKTIAMYISSLQKGGAERVIANLANYFCKQGYRVVLVTTRIAKEEYEVQESIVRRISEPSANQLAGGRISNFIVRFRTLRKIWKEENPDVVLSFIGKNNLMAILTSRFLKIPVAVSVRGEPSMEYYNRWMRFAARHLFKAADGVILQTRQCFQFFPKKVRDKAVILKNPVNQSFFRERYEGERRKELVTVGRIDANKNHEMLIRAFADLAEKYPDYKLIIYGDGELKEELEKLVAELGMEERIALPGSVSNVADAIYKTRVFILSSNTEGLPNTLIEAMILGLTVIATDCPCGGPADLIEHGVNGLLTPVQNVEKLKDNLQNVLNNLQNADEMGRNAAKTGDIYRPEKVYKEWENYLDSLIFKGK